MDFIYNQLPGFDSQPDNYKKQIKQKVEVHLKSKQFSAETFEMYSLQGTPSSIIVDRKGILRDVSFGQTGNSESIIQSLIEE